MIVIKTILFFLGLVFTFFFLEDFILRIIMENKENEKNLHNNFIHGYITIVDSGKIIMMIVVWTCFYLMYQL